MTDVGGILEGICQFNQLGVNRFVVSFTVACQIDVYLSEKSGVRPRVNDHHFVSGVVGNLFHFSLVVMPHDDEVETVHLLRHQHAGIFIPGSGCLFAAILIIETGMEKTD